MELPFVTLDVFTTTPFKGNPLAVVTIPASLETPPTQEQKQAIACEFNLSETVFIHEAHTDSQSQHDRSIDIFLVDREVPFAGHPTIGAAISVLDQDVHRFIAKAGPIDLTKTGDRIVQAEIPHNVHVHAKRLRDLNLDFNTLESPDEHTLRQAELDSPVVSIVNGMTFILIELPTLELLAKVPQSMGVPPVDELLDEGWRDSFVGRYFYVRTNSQAGDSTPVTIRSRSIEPTMEDPATGSAASALCSYLSLSSAEQGGQAEKMTKYEVTQGVEMGRESNMFLEVKSTSDKIQSVKLAGTATQVMRGFIHF